MQASLILSIDLFQLITSINYFRPMKILIIGGGNMGLTFAKSFINSKIVDHRNMLILEKSMKKAAELEKLELGTVFGEPDSYVEDADLIILAVKPQDIQQLFTTIKPYICNHQVILSIMAGVKIATIQEGLGLQKVVRVMPNLPSQIGTGMSVFSSSEEVTRIELAMVQNLLSASGKTVYTSDETMIDAATAVSGSGPAYVFYFMKGMIESAKQLGFSQSEAELLSYQTFKGAIELFNKHDFTCEEWIAKVTSKGGTTAAAFDSFKKQRVMEGYQEGIESAFRRAQELSELE